MALSTAFAQALVASFSLMAAIVIGFNLQVINSLGATYTPLLADSAIRSPRLWGFLGLSLAGTATSVFDLLFPPTVHEEMLIPALCLVGAVVLLGTYLKSVP